MSMLKLAADPSDSERLLDEVYPGRDIVVLDWPRCLECDQDVDGYIFVSGIRFGYCNSHYWTHRNAE